MKTIKLKMCYIVLAVFLIAGIYLSSVFKTLYPVLINPMIWIMLTSIIIAEGKDTFNRNDKETSNYQKKTLIILLVYLIVYCLLGLVVGYVKSPFSLTPIAFLKNIWQFIICAFFTEYVRSTMLNANRKNKNIIVMTIVLFILLNINYQTFMNSLKDSEETFIYFFGTICPLIATQLVTSYLSLKGTWKLSYIYVAFIGFMTILLPIYPNMDWFATGILGILLPVIIYIIIKYDILKNDRHIKRKYKKSENPLYYVPAISFVILVALFMMGVFKYVPISILSNSMKPIYSRGDVIVTEKITKESLKYLKKDDIITYIINNQIVAHRIVEIVNENGVTMYRTQGDNNTSADFQLVKENQIKGIYKFSIKYIGYPSVYLNEVFKKGKAVVETG